MKSTKSIALVAAFLLILTGVWFLPNVSGKSPENSLPDRLTMLEEIVAELSLTVEELNERVDELEAGSGGSCSCSILNLEPLTPAEIPNDPSEGDLCVVNMPPTSEPDTPYGYTLYVYLNGDWAWLSGTTTPPLPPPD